MFKQLTPEKVIVTRNGLQPCNATTLHDLWTDVSEEQAAKGAKPVYCGRAVQLESGRVVYANPSQIQAR